MNALNIDFRDGAMRVLVVGDGSIKYSRIVGDFRVDEGHKAEEVLISALSEAGQKRGKANLILPSGVMNYRTFELPEMDTEDARKVIGRDLLRESEGRKTVFGIRRLAGKSAGKNALMSVHAEYAYYDDIVKYTALLKACGLKTGVVTNSLEGNLRFFKKYGLTEEKEAVIDIGREFLEFALFSSGKLQAFAQLPVRSAPDETAEDGKGLSSDHSGKMRIYRTVDLLYNFIMKDEDFRDEKPSKFWICGFGALDEGIVDSISNGLGVKSALPVSPLTALEEGMAFSSAMGSSISGGEDIVDLTPEEFASNRAIIIKRAVLAASLAVYAGIFAAGFIVLQDNEREVAMLREKAASQRLRLAEASRSVDIYSSGAAAFGKIISGSPNLYPVFRDIADRTPGGVVLNSIDIENDGNVTKLKLSARIRYNDENFKNALLSRFLESLDGSESLRRYSPPVIATIKTGEYPKEISVSAMYEVIR